jgi:hypothetical protein
MLVVAPPSTWDIDPDVPSLAAWELREGAYAEVAIVTGDETYAAQLPYPVEVSPGDLID